MGGLSQLQILLASKGIITVNDQLIMLEKEDTYFALQNYPFAKKDYEEY
jgi:hypothetical protein